MKTLAAGDPSVNESAIGVDARYSMYADGRRAQVSEPRRARVLLAVPGQRGRWRSADPLRDRVGISRAQLVRGVADAAAIRRELLPERPPRPSRTARRDRVLRVLRGRLIHDLPIIDWLVRASGCGFLLRTLAQRARAARSSGRRRPAPSEAASSPGESLLIVPSAPWLIADSGP
jgi:hypothetical protein